MKKRTKRQKGVIYECPNIVITMLDREDILITSAGWAEEQSGWGDGNGEFPEEFGA